MRRGLWLLVGAVCLGGCGRGGADAAPTEGGEVVSAGLEAREDAGRCVLEGDARFVAEHDTNGDGLPEVRQLFRGGEGGEGAAVLVCREVDLDGDGIKDVVRFYRTDGSLYLENADRDFDGDIDALTFFEGGQPIRRDVDTDGDDRVDERSFFVAGAVVRIERDSRGRDAEGAFRTDRWELLEGGRVVRVGVDVDGDGVADRWDHAPRAADPAL